jgi:SNF2 family DNA or RNA helicase
MEGDVLRKYVAVINSNPRMLAFTGASENPQAFMTGYRTASLSLTDSPKIDYAINQAVEYVSQGKKVVIYTSFVDQGLNILGDRLTDLGIEYGSFTGSMPASQREMVVANYNSNAIKVLLLSPAGATGLDLKATDAIFILDPPWSSASLKQAIGRVVRYRSHVNAPSNVVNVYKLINKTPRHILSIDERIYELVAKKESMENDVMRMLRIETI